MRPCRDYTPDGIAQKLAKRWLWRAQRLARRINGRRREWMRETGYESPHTVPVYPQLAMRNWRHG